MYGWSPHQIGELTLAQAMIYASDGEVSTARVRRFASVAEAMAFQQASQGKR